MRQPRTLREQIQAIREDGDALASSLEGLTGWMREARVKRIAELDAVIAKLVQNGEA